MIIIIIIPRKKGNVGNVPFFEFGARGPVPPSDRLPDGQSPGGYQCMQNQALREKKTKHGMQMRRDSRPVVHVCKWAGDNGETWEKEGLFVCRLAFLYRFITRSSCAPSSCCFRRPPPDGRRDATATAAPVNPPHKRGGEDLQKLL